MVVDFQASGMTRVEFCQEHGLALSTLARYQRRRQHEQGEGDGSGRWVAVELAGSQPAGASGLAVVLAGGRRVEVSRGFDAKTLGQLIRLLEPV